MSLYIRRLVFGVRFTVTPRRFRELNHVNFPPPIPSPPLSNYRRHYWYDFRWPLSTIKQQQEELIIIKLSFIISSSSITELNTWKNVYINKHACAHTLVYCFLAQTSTQSHFSLWYWLTNKSTNHKPVLPDCCPIACPGGLIGREHCGSDGLAQQPLMLHISKRTNLH